MNPFPFVPLAGESPLAFQAFMIWFNLKDRKLKNVAEAMDISIGTVKNWSAEFGWADRLLQYKASLMGNLAQVEADVIKKQTLAKAELDIQAALDRAVRLQQAKDLHRRLTDEYVLHNSEKTRLHELTGLMAEIAKEERIEALFVSKSQSNQQSESDAKFEEELHRAYGESVNPPPANPSPTAPASNPIPPLNHKRNLNPDPFWPPPESAPT